MKIEVKTKSPWKLTAVILTAVGFAASTLAGCSSVDSGQSNQPGNQSDMEAISDVSRETNGEVTVFAAASLNKVFPQIAEEVFNKEYPNVKVTFSFDGSKSLIEQLSAGAPADVLATADEKNMDTASADNLVTAPKIFAQNVLTLVTPIDNPGKITGVNDSLDGQKLVICAPGVPCGNATEKLAALVGITLKPVSEEQSVTDVLGKVESGQADAGLVYATDAKSAEGKVLVIPVQQADEVVNRYPIAQVDTAKDPKLAEAFIEAVLSPDGQRILESYGFGIPDPQ